MRIDKKLDRQTLILRLDGDLDMNTSETLRQAIDNEIERRGVRTVLLNLNDVSFVDSSGLGVILGRYKKLLPIGGKVIITNAPPHVYKIMELSGLTKIISFYDDESMAQNDGKKGNAR